MPNYEYVSRNEYQPVREELELIIRKAQKILRKETGITFQFELIGSGSKHLITRVVGGNKGFDFDYNVIINYDDGQMWKADYARKEFTKALDKAIEGTQYDHPQNSSVAVTIKVKDVKQSRIRHSCDFAIVYYPGNKDDGYKFAKLNLKTNQITWEMREHTKQYRSKLDWLRENVNGYWNRIMDEYLRLKNSNNDPNKHSFQLFYEALNNVFNRYRTTVERPVWR